ncbi:MAG: TVP38/TMEM64 family protein [Myxococcota bacterium]
MPEPTPSRTKQAGRLVSALLRSPALYWIAAILVGGAILASWVEAVGGPEAIHARFGTLAPLVTGTVQLVLAPTPIPTDLICIAHGTLYGFFFASVLNWLGWWLGSLVEFAIGRRIGADLDLAASADRVPGWLRRFPVDHPIYLIGSRQVPVVGSHLSTSVPGAVGVPFHRVAWCSAIGVIPGAAFFAAIGAGLLQL